MTGHIIPLAYSAAIFFFIGSGGLTVLRRQHAVGTRIGVFLLFCVVAVFATLWATKKWQLLMGEAALAWIVALLLTGLVTLGITGLRTTTAFQK